MERVESEISTFLKLQQAFKEREFEAKDLCDFAFSLHPKEDKRKIKSKDYAICFSGIIHGNETIGLAIINQLLKDLLEEKVPLNQPLAFVLGNVPAARDGKRYLEKDLNRSFNTKSTGSLEERRAKEIEEIVKNSQYAFDIHQTIEPCNKPFYIFNFDKRKIALAKKINKDLPIVTIDMDFSSDGEPMGHFADEQGVVCLAVEMGQAGFNEEQEKLGLQLCEEFLKLSLNGINKVQEEPFDSENVYQIFEILKNTEHNIELLPDWKNLDPIKKNQLIAYEGEHEVLASEDCFILFPRYGEYAKKSSEVGYYVREL